MSKVRIKDQLSTAFIRRLLQGRDQGLLTEGEIEHELLYRAVSDIVTHFETSKTPMASIRAGTNSSLPEARSVMVQITLKGSYITIDHVAGVVEPT